MNNSVALVTGAAGGIGLACAEALANKGCQVIISDRDEARGREEATRLGACFIAADLASGEDCRRLIDQARARCGGVDILVNNAGFQAIHPIEEFPEDTWERLLAVMLTAPFRLARSSWPHMRARGWGRIVNIGSVHSLRASPFKAGYVAAKHGLLGLTRTLALEGGPHGITANLVAPAYVRTPLVEAQIADQARTRGIPAEAVVEQVMLARAATKRLIEPAEVGELVAFLCSDAGRSVTGAAWTMDLGWTAQ
jgi:3-hydroxybutyrate dehydrogenase